MPTSIQLVPPSLRVIAAVITRKKDFRYAVDRLVDRAEMCQSYRQLEVSGYPCIKAYTDRIGNGLTLTYTESEEFQPFYRRPGLVWLAEEACHPLCSFIGRECQEELTALEWLQKIEKIHRFWLDRMPTA